MKKIVKKNFNDELESVLEQKEFEENVKSTLLSILYKIEAAYRDISIVKPDIYTKEEYIKKLIWTIQYQCDSVKLVRMGSEDTCIPKHATFFIDKEKKKLECYPIERKVLYAIWKLGKKECLLKSGNSLIDMALSDFLNVGNTIDFVEPLRDFNGYSWTTLFTEIESIAHNLIYQNLRILVGNQFLTNWVFRQEMMIDYYDELKENLNNEYGQKLAGNIIKEWITIAILLERKFTPEKMLPYEIEKKRVEKEFVEMQDKPAYIEAITKQKLKLSKKIKEIDKILNSKVLLQQEYIKRNEVLPLDKKIFSMRVLSQQMKQEREKICQRVETLNQHLNPKNYVRYKKELEQKYKYLALLDIEDLEKAIQRYLVRFQKRFLMCFSMQIDKHNTKQEIITLLYQFRYYLQLPITREKHVYEEIPETLIKPVMQKLLSKAEELKAIQKITKNEETMYQIWKAIFAVRAIRLEDVSIKLTKDKKDQYILQVFDEDMFEEKIPMKKLQEMEEVKLNKKLKIFD